MEKIEEFGGHNFINCRFKTRVKKSDPNNQNQPIKQVPNRRKVAMQPPAPARAFESLSLVTSAPENSVSSLPLQPSPSALKFLPSIRLLSR